MSQLEANEDDAGGYIGGGKGESFGTTGRNGSVAAVASSGDGRVGREAQAALPPEASEEDWQRRAEKRRAFVALIKATPEYQQFAQAFAARGPDERFLHENGAQAPRTPDPADRTVSKRHWDQAARLWRLELAAQRGGIEI